MPSATSLKSIKDAKKKLTKFLKTLETVPQEELEKQLKRFTTKLSHRYLIKQVSWRILFT